jgi:hypothetical protein
MVGLVVETKFYFEGHQDRKQNVEKKKKIGSGLFVRHLTRLSFS